MSKEDIYFQLSNKLFEVFYVDDKKFGRQQKDGSYKLVKEKISPVTIHDMLLNQKSLLTYQELHIVGSALIKWICIDLDIEKKEIDKNEVNYDNLKFVKEAADEVCSFLESIHISYLLEFSGRRGFHIWIVFDRLITKENGFRFINYIISNVKDKFNEIIIADKFPKTAFVNPKTKGVGFGIKLPLSQNKGSGKLSFLLKKDTPFEFDQDKWLSKPNNQFLEDQFEIINSLKSVSLEKIQPFIDEYSSSLRVEKKAENFLRTKKINSFLPDNINLERILESLRKCEHLEKILYDYEKGLGGKERAILVGLLGQLKTKDDSDFGHKILMELFSNIQNFNPETTEKNLNNLKYFQPITCSNFGKCSSCDKCNLISPVQLIDNIDLIDKPSYSIRQIDESLFDKMKNSIYQYSLKNDEVPLYPQLRKSSKLTLDEINIYMNSVYVGGGVGSCDSYMFKRNETNKIRLLYNLDPINNFVSTYFTFILNTLYYTEISNNSYGYQFSGSLYQNNIFNNWFANWAKFSKEIEKVLFSEEYDDYYVLKLDIKSFYDKIDLKRLRIKLYEEAPANIREKLNELSDDDKSKYKNIIDYLIDLSIKTTNSEIGLPQGPAYARYLAELYLNGLDSLIEKTFITDQRREFYNRFVDDIFIFVESEERAVELYNKIKEWLSINNLELNSDKSKVLNVRTYADSGEYHKYKDNVKYDINYVNKNKNVLSEEEIQKAFYELDVLTDETKFGIKDNLRFFYNQFKGDKRLEFIRAKLSKKIPFSDDGRGALYMMFYADLLLNFKDVFWDLAKDIDKIKGLSFTHYLNTILLNDDLINENLHSINNLIEKCIIKDNISDADKLLIASICVKCNLNVKLNYPQKIMYSALEIPNMKYTIDLWDIMYEKLRELDDKKFFLKELERIIYDNTYDIGFLNKISEHSFLRFSQWKAEKYIIEDNYFLKSYYHCLSFFTLFFNSSESKNLEEAWELLLEESKRIGKISDDRHQFKWVSKTVDFDYSDFSNGKGSYLLVLSDMNGSKLGEIDCKNNFLKSYKEVLVTLLFSKGKTINVEQNELLTTLNKIETDDDSLFYKWIKDPSVDLFPQVEEANVCLKNVALNGLIVLSKGNEIFIKSLNKDLDTRKYEFLNISSENGKEFVYEYEFSCLTNKLNSSSLLGVLKNLTEIIDRHHFFIEKYNTNYPVFYYPALDVNLNPIVPFYSDYEEKIDFKGNNVSNSLEKYWENLNYIISDKLQNTKEIKLTLDNNLFNFTLNELEGRFFPESKLIVNSITEKIDFLKHIINYLGEEKEISIFQFQYYWSAVVFSFAEKLKNGNQDFINFLKIHFDLFTDNKIIIDIFFSVDEKIDLKESNLFEFYETIKKSINIFQSEVSIDNIDFLSLLSSYIPALFYENESAKLSFDLNDFVLGNVSVSTVKDRVLGTTTYNLVVDGNAIVGEIDIYLFNDIKREFEIKKIEEVEIISRKNKIFHFINLNKIFIYIPENEIINSFERIKERKSIYERVVVSSQDNEGLNLRNLFPINQYYTTALTSFNKFSGKNSLISKLKLQYVNDFQIEDRIVNWLSIFNIKSIEGSVLENYMDGKFTIENLHHSILTVLEKHIPIDSKHIDLFSEKMDQYEKNKYILFSIKNAPNDQNGLFRLIGKIKSETDRVPNFDTVFSKILCGNNDQSDVLVIISDVSISGGQFRKAIKNYYFKDFKDDKELKEYFLNGSPSSGESSPLKEKYFSFIDKKRSDIFKVNFRNFKKIIFLSPLMTERFKEVVSEVFNEFGVNSDLEFVCVEPALKDEYLFKNITSLNMDRKELFETLVKDIGLICKLFNVNKRRYYKDSLGILEDTNLIFRLGSLPKRHIKLFTLEPNKGKKALDYIKELE